MSQPITVQSGHLVFSIGPKNTNSVKDNEIFLPVKFLQISSAVSEETSKMSQPIRGQGGHLVIPIGPPLGPGGLSRECAPPYPQRDRKRRVNGAVCRNHRIKRLVPCRC